MNSWPRSREVEKPKSQVSIAELSEHQQDAAMHETEVASARYPSVLVAGHLLHVCEMGGTWQVWLNCEDADFTGVCVALGASRQEAIFQAVHVFEAVTEALQQPTCPYGVCSNRAFDEPPCIDCQKAGGA